MRGAACGVGVRAAGCRVGRPFSGGRHGRVARGAHASRFRGARVFGVRASGAGDAVNDKYENKTVTVCMSTRSDPIYLMHTYVSFITCFVYYLLGHVSRNDRI